MNSVKNSAIIILGASGDLAKRKLIPALDALKRSGEIGEGCKIIGSGRKKFSDDEFRRHFKSSESISSQLHYHSGIKGLRGFLDTLGDFKNIIIFFSLPPKVYADTADALHQEGFGRKTRIIIEKPFGYDLKSARELNRRLSENFEEEQIYRIDHYLAKEAVQNLLIFRFANSLFDPLWNAANVESIQINASEVIGVESRGAYFDGSGVIRDMVQNHLMQMLALLTMEAPVSLDSEDIRNQKANVLKTMEVIRSARGQYEGYRQEPMVNPNSNTETFAELELRIHNFRWEGVPIYIRSGKALSRKGTEIGIRFKQIPRLLFNADGKLEPNRIIFHIQPTTGIVIDHAVKVPGTDNDIAQSRLDFSLSDAFGPPVAEDAYQRLLMDALDGDSTLYVSAKETEMAWEVLDEVLESEQPFLYRQGEMPESPLEIDWIDFEDYKGKTC
ncbi:MAG: glucose-6-phosphate dehydrogenase [Spirochaetaceae bacterium]|nr:glucose-6-phosphate dehydrogenase [Spirochaetaceae bacterium]